MVNGLVSVIEGDTTIAASWWREDTHLSCCRVSFFFGVAESIDIVFNKCCHLIR